MASLTRAQARDLARLLAQDTATTAPGVSDTKANALLEEQRQWYASLFPEDTLSLAYDESSPGVTTSLSLTTTDTFRTLDVCVGMYGGKLLERVDYHLLAQRSQYDTLNGVAATLATSWGAIRTGDTAWSVLLWPSDNVAKKIRLYGHHEVAPLSADGDLVLFGNHGSRVIARLAAIELARACGRPSEFIAAIAAQLPERVMTRRADLARMLSPQAMRT